MKVKKNYNYMYCPDSNAPNNYIKCTEYGKRKSCTPTSQHISHW